MIINPCYDDWKVATREWLLLKSSQIVASAFAEDSSSRCTAANTSFGEFNNQIMLRIVGSEGDHSSELTDLVDTCL